MEPPRLTTKTLAQDEGDVCRGGRLRLRILPWGARHDADCEITIYA
jgi:hypothetical protein